MNGIGFITKSAIDVGYVVEVGDFTAEVLDVRVIMELRNRTERKEFKINQGGSWIKCEVITGLIEKPNGLPMVATVEGKTDLQLGDVVEYDTDVRSLCRILNIRLIHYRVDNICEFEFLTDKNLEWIKREQLGQRMKKRRK